MARKRINREIDAEAGTVTFTEVASGKSVVANVAEFGDAMLRRLTLHGMNAKFGDSAADPEVDAIATITAAIETVKGGEWSTRGEGGGGARMTDLAQALMNVTGQEQDTVMTKLGDMSDEEKKDLRAHPAIKAQLADIRATREREKARAAKKAAEAGDVAELNF